MPQRKTIHLPMSLAIAACLLPFQASYGEPVDPAAIARLLGKESLPQTAELDADASRKMLDALASLATRQIDPGNRDWNPTSPKWKPVFDRVRGDFAAQLPAILATAKSAGPRLERDYEAAIASGLSEADLNALLAYYDSAQGKRYQAFMQRVDRVMASGERSLVARDAPPSVRPTQEQIERYLPLVQMSHLFQSTVAMSDADQAAHRDISGYGAIGFFAGAAIMRNLAELEALWAEYFHDLPDFQAFEQTEASRHFFRAMGLATQRIAGRANPIADSLGAIAAKHESQWKALYQAQALH